MSDWKCSVCGYKCSSLSQLKQHILEEHNSYSEPAKSDEIKDLTIETLNKLRSVKKQVHWLYINKPSTKGNDELLILEHLKYFQDMLIYTAESQRINFKDPRGISYEQFQYMISPETITRCGRKIREQDRKLYHDKDGAIREEHLCLLGSPKSELRRQRRQEVYRTNIKYI